MKIERLIGFITKLEEMRKMCNPEDMVKDSCGTYPKNEVLANLIKDARYLIQYGEYRIALENLLDNLAEYEITLDDQTLDLAVCAFDNNISLHDKKALAALQRDERMAIR